MSEIVKHKPAEVQLTDKEYQLCQSLHLFNQLREFKLNTADILEWKDTLLEFFPDLTPEKLSFCIKQMISGKLEYEKHKGILSLVNGLNRVEQSGDEFRVKSDMVW